MRTAFSVSKSVPAKVAAIVIPIAASGPIPSGVGLNRGQLAALGFEGKTSQTHTLTPAAGKTAVRVLVGIGDVRDLNTSVLRNVAASAAHASSRYESIATTLPGVIRGSAKTSTQAVVEGIALALHRWVALKNDKSGLVKLTSVTLVSAEKTADGFEFNYIPTSGEYSYKLENMPEGTDFDFMEINIVGQDGIQKKIKADVEDKDYVFNFKKQSIIRSNLGGNFDFYIKIIFANSDSQLTDKKTLSFESIDNTSPQRPTDSSISTNLKDINNLEALMLITLAILVILFGFYPSPLMDTLNISVNNLINNYEIAIRANGLN